MFPVRQATTPVSLVPDRHGGRRPVHRRCILPTRGRHDQTANPHKWLTEVFPSNNDRNGLHRMGGRTACSYGSRICAAGEPQKLTGVVDRVVGIQSCRGQEGDDAMNR